MSKALSGMTGFARIAGEAEWGSWAWEIKSVNGRGLDIRVNTPPGFDTLERSLKAAAAKRFKRGSMQAGLRIDLAASEGAVSINGAALDALVEQHVQRTGGPIGQEALAALMTVKGVVEAGGAGLRDLAGDEALITDLSLAAEDALDQLAEARREEGRSLAALLTGLLDQMQGETAQAEKVAGEQPKLIKARLETQLADLGAEANVDADRLAAEVALSAAKADVREELDRLAAHIETGRGLIAEGSPAGRKIDFLAQELNREANTLCSKSASLDLTNAGLSLKALIDQFKEQAANVE